MDENPDYTSLYVLTPDQFWGSTRAPSNPFDDLLQVSVDLDFRKAALFTGVALPFQMVFPVILA